MRAALLQGRSARRSACLVGLASVAMACQTPASIRYRTLSEDWQRTASPAERSLDSGEDLFLGSAALDRRALVESGARAQSEHRGGPPGLAGCARALSPGNGTRRSDAGHGRGAALLRLEPGRPRGELRPESTPALSGQAEAARRGGARGSGGDGPGPRDPAPSARDARLGAVRRLRPRRALARDQSRAQDDARRIPADRALALCGGRRFEAERAPGRDGADARALRAERARELLPRSSRDGSTRSFTAPSTCPCPPPRASSAFPRTPPIPIEGRVSRALAVHPELAAASARVAAAEARVDLAQQEFLPDFTLTGAYDRRWQESDLAPFVGVQVNVPLQLGTTESGARGVAGRFRRHAPSPARARGRRALRRPERFAAPRTGAPRGAAGARPAAARRRRTGEAARSAYAAGRSSFLVLIDALRELHEIELGHQESLAQIGRRRAELDRALGRVPGLAW